MADRWPITRYAITGGTGFLGRAIIRRLVDDGSAERVVSVSRDEVKVGELLDEYGLDGVVRPLLGDVRDTLRLMKAFSGCQVVIHAAALKRVQSGAYSPSEIIQTNVIGTMNVIEAAAAAGVKRVIVVSSDKACEPANIYGATKLCAEFHAVQANAYSYPRGMAIACVRYGNVLGSRGSVLEVWRRQLAAGEPLTVTDPAMTRFIITPAEAVTFVLDACYDANGGEVFVPVLPAATVGDLWEAVVREHNGITGEIRDLGEIAMLPIGLRPGGEKAHERLLSEEERLHRLAFVDEGRYAVLPTHREWSAEPYMLPLPNGTFSPYRPAILERPYESATTRRLSVDELRKLVAEMR